MSAICACRAALVTGLNAVIRHTPAARTAALARTGGSGPGPALLPARAGPDRRCGGNDAASRLLGLGCGGEGCGGGGRGGGGRLGRLVQDGWPRGQELTRLALVED